MDYEFFESAKEELADAIHYYESDTPGIGFDLTDEVENVLGRLLRFPLSAPLVTKRVRKAVLHSYPYNIMYYIQDDTIFIVAFMHQKRKPGYWKKRIQ
ncbi:MAG: type II toxin-antitoxin system RelE/ParE family toxin [Candidatus Kapaibacterium sp.]